jgi:threonine aldolase
MAKTFTEICKSANYKLTGSGSRQIGALVKSFENMDPNTDSDVYGAGKIINDFEDEISQLLGKESAAFFPSGTMAQQIALRIWCDKLKSTKVAYHPLCHLEIHENDGLKVLHHLEPILLGNSDRLFTLQDLKLISEPISCLLIELPQREIGGQLPTWEELVEISEYCKAKGIKLHLDGARLFEVLPYYNKSASAVCSLFDSVYVSFYKGLGGIAGAMLAGNSEFIEESKVWKRRHGGDLISLYPYIINAKYSLNKRIGNMKTYWNSAMSIAEKLNKIEGVEITPKVPVCNMFHAYFSAPKEVMENILADIVEKHGLALITSLREVDNKHCKAELTFGDSINLIPQGLLETALNHFNSELIKARKNNSF